MGYVVVDPFALGGEEQDIQILARELESAVPSEGRPIFLHATQGRGGAVVTLGERAEDWTIRLDVPVGESGNVLSREEVQRALRCALALGSVATDMTRARRWDEEKLENLARKHFPGRKLSGKSDEIRVNNSTYIRFFDDWVPPAQSVVEEPYCDNEGANIQRWKDMCPRLSAELQDRTEGWWRSVNDEPRRLDLWLMGRGRWGSPIGIRLSRSGYTVYASVDVSKEAASTSCATLADEIIDRLKKRYVYKPVARRKRGKPGP